MADENQSTDGPSPFTHEAYDYTKLPDWDDDFIDDEALDTFANVLAGPDPAASPAPQRPERATEFITALNDWKPIRQRTRRDGLKRKKRRPPKSRKDETREGFVYTILKWPLLLFVMTWIICLGISYMITRLYVYSYEQFVTMRGQRERLRKRLNTTTSYEDWVRAAKQMDKFLGNDGWKEEDDYAYYNSGTVRTVRDSLRKLRSAIEQSSQKPAANPHELAGLVDELRVLVEASAKDNFVGVENAHLYSETYYGTKHLVQSFVEEVELSLATLLETDALSPADKAQMFKHLYANFGRTALCLSGGATFAYYHFGIAKAMLDADVLPEVITGTSGGALVAALLATRTDEELKKLLVPALAYRITACGKEVFSWARFMRWWRTGANFDSVDWARRCSWFCRGSLTFREAYERTGRILNVTCIPSDPHSPTVLANYRTSPDCVIWSAVLASAAVPGILNPVVLMKKNKDGSIAPFSFGHRWKDGSLRTDIPLKSLNTHFNVTFSIVSQVNPHINLFFFSSRGTIGRPVTHRRGRGWRGGFLGSATEQYIKLDLTKWLKVLRHLELLPRYAGQDWSQIWLQRFSGTVTIWPKCNFSDFLYILSDPPPARLARMIHRGQLAAFPKLKFVANRMAVERRIDAGLRKYARDTSLPTAASVNGGISVPVPSVLSEDDLQGLLAAARRGQGLVGTHPAHLVHDGHAPDSPTFRQRLSGWFGRREGPSPRNSLDGRRPAPDEYFEKPAQDSRRSSVISEIGRQSRVFFDDTEAEGGESETGSAVGSAVESEAEEQVEKAPVAVHL